MVSAVNTVRMPFILGNKSFWTNAISLGLVAASYCFMDTPYQKLLHNIGFFALSGALTNWLAIVMLFDKIPFLYGSGVIPAQFEEFKLGIRNLILQEFFTKENITAAISGLQINKEKWAQLPNDMDYNKIFEALVEAIMESSFGKMLALVGGAKTIESLRQPIVEKIRTAVTQMWMDEKLQAQCLEKLGLKDQQQSFYVTVEKLVDQRLEKLTPKMVKEIIQRMIRIHLGWLVVWGGVFGGIIGFITTFI
jgi:uncharacterized membrane protein YheB (UPF0754 family)